MPENDSLNPAPTPKKFNGACHHFPLASYQWNGASFPSNDKLRFSSSKIIEGPYPKPLSVCSTALPP